MIITSHNKQQSTRIEYASSDSLVMGCNVPAFCTSGPAPVNDVSDVKFPTQSLCTSAHSIVLWCYNNSRSLSIRLCLWKAGVILKIDQE